MKPLVFNACLLVGWLLVSIGAGLWSLPAGLVTAGASLVVLTFLVARLGGVRR